MIPEFKNLNQANDVPEVNEIELDETKPCEDLPDAKIENPTVILFLKI